MSYFIRQTGVYLGIILTTIIVCTVVDQGGISLATAGTKGAFIGAGIAAPLCAWRDVIKQRRAR